MSKMKTGHYPSRTEDKARRAISRPPCTHVRFIDGRLIEFRVYMLKLAKLKVKIQQLQDTLKESRGFIDNAPVGYLAISNRGKITEANLTAASMLGFERNKLLHRHLADFMVSADRVRWRQHFAGLLKHNEKSACELFFRRGDKESFLAHLDCLSYLRESQEPVVRIVLTDITERKQMDKDLREHEEFFRMIAENTEDFIAVLDMEGRRLYNNPSYARIFGATARLNGTDSFSEIHSDDRERVKQIFMETVRSGTGLKADFRFVLSDGSVRYMESRGGLIKNSQGHALHVVVVSRDITERKLTEEETRNFAFHDALTKLPKRRLLSDRLIQSMAAGKRSGYFSALLYLDLDNFKPLNDQHGHAVGDLLLQEVARRTSNCVRELDTVSRYGGDEFVVLLTELDADKSRAICVIGHIAEKIRGALAEPYLLVVKMDENTESIVTHHCTASIGVELFMDHEISPDEILMRADFAMYQAKGGGRNSVCFFDSNSPKLFGGGQLMRDHHVEV